MANIRIPDKWLSMLLAGAAVSLFISISISQILLVLILVLLLHETIKGRVDLREFPLWLPMGIYILALAVTVPFSEDVFRSLSGLRSRWTMLYMPVAFFCASRLDQRWILKWLLIGGMMASAFAFIQSNTLNIAPTAFYSHHLSLGNVLAMLAILAVTFAVIEKDRIRRRFYAISAGLILIGLFSSWARGSILAFLTVTSFLLLLRFSWKGLLGMVLVVAVLGSGLALSSTKRQRFDDLWNWRSQVAKSDTSLGTRMVLWKTALDMFRDEPITGVGLKRFTQEAKRRINVPVQSTAHAHNIYLEHLATTGIIGFFGLCALFFGIIRRLWQRMRMENPWVVSGLMVCLTFLLCGLTENTIGDSEVVMVLWFIIGLCLSSLQADTR